MVSGMSPVPKPQSRVRSVDALRGFVMIVMALDHTREFFHAGAMTFQPEDLTRTTAALFFTRWITHICAPVFMFTAGTAAFLWLQRGRTKRELSSFLLKRGLWLVVLDLTVFRFAMTFGRGMVILSVLWALGWSMVALSILIHIPVRALTTLSIAAIALHNLTDSLSASQFGSFAWFWHVVHQTGVFPVDGTLVLTAYPLVPWVAVMAAGFCLGQVVILDAPVRRQWMFRLGLALSLAFVVIRTLNIYGDPLPWSNQPSGMTILSFLRTTKYPPSLDFLLMTLGPALLLLAWFDRAKLSLLNPLVVFGRVPLFYFIVHFLLLRALTIPFAFLRYGEAGFLLNPLPSMGGDIKTYPPGFGYELPPVYFVWIGIVVALYPVCLWFGRVKERRKNWWLSYM